MSLTSYVPGWTRSTGARADELLRAVLIMWAVKVHGLPAPKGSMKCIGQRGKVKHQLVEDYRVGQKEWRERVEAAGQALADEYPDDLPMARHAAVSIEITFTLPLPKSVKPADRLWPTVDDSRDVDKLTRLAFDALTGPVIPNDAQIVEMHVHKAYPHSPAPDVLDDQGAHFRIWRTET